MSASGATTNYNLSQFISTDIPSWLGDYNGDMLKIDTGINGAKLAADSAALAASAAQNDASTALSNVGTLSTTVGTLSNTVGTAVGNINTINSLIGNGTPTTTDQTIIGAINELHADQGDLTNLTTTDKTSLVAAINEIAGGGGGGSTEEILGSVDNSGGTKTFKQVFDELFTAITGNWDIEDFYKYKLVFESSTLGIVHEPAQVGANYLTFVYTYVAGAGLQTYMADLRSGASTYPSNIGGTYSDKGSESAYTGIWKIVKMY